MRKLEFKQLSSEIKNLVLKRNLLRAKGNFTEADKIRQDLAKKKYILIDQKENSLLYTKNNQTQRADKKYRHFFALFGSGETSPTGRKIHEYLIKTLSPPIKIVLLETPAGFETNPHYWYKSLAQLLKTGLQNYQPAITLIAALRNSGEKSTNNPKLLKPLLNADYIHTGAGSPSYAARHLHQSLAYNYLLKQVRKGISCSFASAAAIAFGRLLLPVYEIYKAGEDLHWKKGLDFFKEWGLNLTIIPHWNNTEGGAKIDTSRCYLGQERLEKMLTILPEPTTILGIDEQTACIFDTKKEKIKVLGNGNVTIISGTHQLTLPPNSYITFSRLRGE